MAASKAHPEYKPPRVVTYREDEILKQMGPVGGCSSALQAPMNPFAYDQRRRRPGVERRRYRSSFRSEYEYDINGIEEDDI